MIKRILHLGTAAFILFSFNGFSQDVHFTPFDATPQLLNPAFTGAFDGTARVGTIYRNQWSSAAVPYVTTGVSVDLPLFTDKEGNYLAGGIQAIRDEASDRNQNNFTGIVTLAYHKLFRAFTKEKIKNSDIAVGLQTGYAQKTIALSDVYFGNEWLSVTTINGPYHAGIGYSTHYYPINAGISFAQSISPRFNYIIGFSGNNLNQPATDIEIKQNAQTGMDIQYAGTLGADILITNRFSLRPAVLYIYRATSSEFIGGSEFNYALGKVGQQTFVRSVFVGGWYRREDLAMLTAGAEIQRFRICFSYDHNFDTPNISNNGNGGLDVSIKYVAPGHSRKRTVPCNRF